MAIQEEYASVLSQRAESALRACVTLAEDPEMADDVAGFHAQQAVDKVLKVVLVPEGFRFRAPTMSSSSLPPSASGTWRSRPRSNSRDGSRRGPPTFATTSHRMRPR
jgi:hypothetical protein